MAVWITQLPKKNCPKGTTEDKGRDTSEKWLNNCHLFYLIRKEKSPDVGILNTQPNIP